MNVTVFNTNKPEVAHLLNDNVCFEGIAIAIETGDCQPLDSATFYTLIDGFGGEHDVLVNEAGAVEFDEWGRVKCFDACISGLTGKGIVLRSYFVKPGMIIMSTPSEVAKTLKEMLTRTGGTYKFGRDWATAPHGTIIFDAKYNRQVKSGKKK